MSVQPPQTAAIITPSYAGDFERCKLLAESVRECAPDIPHYIIVDDRDRRLFKSLEVGRTRLVPSEDITAPWLVRLPLRRGLWLNFRGLPVRGWILQQLLKIGASNVLSEDVLVNCDSDIAFFRRVSLETFLKGDAVRLFDTAFCNEEVIKWDRVSCALLGIEHDGADIRAHVGNMICWRRDVSLALQSHIERTQGKHWQAVLSNQRSFSEYMLYGAFVRRVLGYSYSGHEPTDVPFVKASWGSDLSSRDKLADFMADFDDRTVAVMAHSKDAVDLADLRGHLQKRWASL